MTGLIGSVALCTPWWRLASSATAALLDTSTLTKFVDPLPIPLVRQPVGIRQGKPYYEVTLMQFRQKLHRDLPATTVWGYDGSYPGPTIETRSHQPISVRWINNLPRQQLFANAIDPQIHGAETGISQIRPVVQVQGAHVAPDSDGFPRNWFAPGRNAPANGLGGPAGNSALHHFANSQPATALWYHDHSLEIGRPNVCAGLVGFYLIRDEVEDGLNLPRGPYEIPLLIQDRTFNSDGSLFYPVQGPVPAVMPDGALASSGTPGSRTIPKTGISEFGGDTMLVNGKVWPYLNVEPRKYRFRVLNGCNARNLNLSFDSGPGFFQIGTDGGFLEAPVRLTQLLIAPAGRADLIIDFSAYTGRTLTLINNAPTPYPGGGNANDLARNPDTTTIMQVRVNL